MAEVFRAQVPIERLGYGQWDGNKFNEIKGLRNHAETRVWAVLGVVESGAKTVVAGVAFLVAAFANRYFPELGTNYPIYKDIAETQFHSFWRCALAVYSPSKAIGTGDWIEQQTDWGTKYSPKKTGIIDKCYPWTIA